MTHDADMSDRMKRLHRECWEQIPWIASGAIEAHIYAALEPHLRACSECREELALQERTRALVRRDVAVTLAPQAGWQKLVQRIDAEDVGADAGGQVHARPPKQAPTSARWGRWVALAAGVQAIALAAVLTAQYAKRGDELRAPRFETLTAVSPFAANGPVIRLVFEAEVPLQDVNALLRTVDAQIVAGPSEAGVYTIALKGESHADPDIEAALTQLRADPRVVFAEAAVARSTQ
jgi:hypothetical protein